MTGAAVHANAPSMIQKKDVFKELVLRNLFHFRESLDDFAQGGL